MNGRMMEAKGIAQRFLQYVDQSPSPFHAVEEAVKILAGSGYSKLREDEPWMATVKPGGKYYYTRNGSTLVAFAVGEQYKSPNGFRIIGAHTDSPVLTVKPRPACKAEGYLKVGVQVYGGGQWCTWFDRDLKVAGRLVVRGEDGVLRQRLVHVPRPILRVPTLAIHLNRGLNTEGFKFDLEKELVPVIAAELEGQGEGIFLEAVAAEAGVTAEQVVDFDLVLADCQPSAIGGAREDYIFAPRLDNLMSSFLSLEAMVEAGGLADDTGVRMCVLFDNEEVGSTSYAGANSDIVERAIRRLAVTLAGDASPETADLAFKNSFLISADMAHAVHPNYAARHESQHKPQIGQGLVIKTNANQRYATNASTGAALRELARRRDLPIQDFCVKNSSGCGSTIGPMLSSRGLRTVDVGQPQLSMHSIREMCGVLDTYYCRSLFKAFYEEFESIDRELRKTVD